MDVDVAFRVAFPESVFTRSAGPQHFFVDATANARSPLMPALGLQIAARATPYLEGTGGVYIREGGGSKRVFVLTARHVVVPPNAGRNRDDSELYACTKASQPHREVLLLDRSIPERTRVHYGEDWTLTMSGLDDRSACMPPVLLSHSPRMMTDLC
jgi:hypothetical protein